MEDQNKPSTSGTAISSAAGGGGSGSGSTFKPIGPGDVKKGKYKFVEPPGISDWIISFAKKFIGVGLVYSFGYFQISTGWLVGPIVLMVIREQWRRNHDAQRAQAKAAASGDEREIILARLGDSLPSWVTFPDVERAEWLNQILKQLWPRINNFTYDLVVNTIEPVLRDTLNTQYKLGSFRFEKIILGDMPLRVRGVKVYDEKRTDRNEIIMDLEVIYAGDCDFRFSLAKIKAGIKDLQLSGTLRLVLKPLINQVPLIGGVQYFFLNSPSLDFNLIGIADVFDMPGLSDLIRRIVQEQIAAMCVLPNKMFIQLSETINAKDTCASPPKGVVRICAIEAKNLLKKDVGVLGTGKSDPYVVLNVGAQQFKSKVINNSVNPKWDFHCEMLVEEMGQILNVTLYDHDDAPRADEFLGRTSVDLSLVRREGTVDLWLELEDVKKGAIHLKLTWLGFSENPAELKNALESIQAAGLHSALLTVRLDSIRGLPMVKDSHKPDPYALISIGKQQQESVTLEKTTDPVYEETFYFLVHNPLTDTLLLKMMDRKSGIELGALKQSLDILFSRPKMTLEKQNLSLNNLRSETKATLDMKIQILKSGAWTEEDEENSEKDKEKDAEIAVSKQETGTDDENQKLLPGKKDVREESLEEEKVDASSTSGLSTVPSAAGAGDAENVMKIRLTIRYSPQQQSLVVVVHTVENLPIEKEELPDPYVKLYVLPEKTKKHKTEAQKDQVNPTYDERFDFPLLDLHGKTLHVQVCDKKFIRRSPNIAQAFIPLDDFSLGNAITNWYVLVV